MSRVFCPGDFVRSDTVQEEEILSIFKTMCELLSMSGLAHARVRSIRSRRQVRYRESNNHELIAVRRIYDFRLHRSRSMNINVLASLMPAIYYCNLLLQLTL